MSKYGEKLNEFSKFLAENNASQAFLCLFKTQGEVNEFLENNPPESWIYNLPAWNSTPQGGKYWMNLAVKWAINNLSKNESNEIKRKYPDSSLSEVKGCTCGAKHTSNPNFHLRYCCMSND